MIPPINQQLQDELNAALARPAKAGGLGTLEALQVQQELRQIRRRTQKISVASGAAVKIDPTLPLQVLNVVASQTASKQQDRTFSLVTVTFSRQSDTHYAGVRVWFKGYKGNTQWQLMTGGSDSPVSFLEEATGETVQVKVQAFNQSGMGCDFNAAPTTTVVLSGVISAPPAPTVTQNVTPVVGGFQFTFSIEGGLLADVVDSYKVYRNTVNNSGSAVVCQTIKHPQSNNGSYVVQDYPGGDSVYFYWVSAVNTVGLESSLTAAQSGTNAALATQQAFGKNLVPNPGFENDALGIAGSVTTVGYPVCDGWAIANNDGGVFTFSRSSATSHSGTYAGLIDMASGVVLTNGSTYNGIMLSTAKLPVAIGDIVRASAWNFTNRGVAAPSGVTITLYLGAVVYNAAGAVLGYIFSSVIPNFAGTWANYQAALTIPNTLGGGVPAWVQAYVQQAVVNSSGSSQTTSTWCHSYFDDVRVVLQNTAFDLTPVSTSGTPTSTTGLCKQATSTGTTINIVASTWQFGDGTISYNSGSVNPGSFGTWYVYADDPTYSGGTVTYVATATPSNVNAANGRIFFGKITTVNGSTPTSTGGGTGGGGPNSKLQLS